MSKTIIRTYSRYSRDAVRLLGGLIRASRIERKMTAQEAADRAGISRGLLQRIEKGDMKCEIGAAFELAAIVGVELFGADETSLSRQLARVEDRQALLPKAVRSKPAVVKDDF